MIITEGIFKKCVLFKKIVMKIHKELPDSALPMEQDDDASSVNTDVSTEPLFIDEDIISSTPKPSCAAAKSNQDISYSVLYSKELDESKLKEEEIDLYKDLVRNADAENIYRQNLEKELENLKKELQTVKDADVEKSATIEKLTTENTQLKKSICSLYQTVKSEIEHKDNLLAEANRKLDSFYRKEGQNFRPSRETRNQSYEELGNRPYKRKRSNSPQPLNNVKEPKPNTSKTNNEQHVLPAKNGSTQSKLYNSKETHSNEPQRNNNQPNKCTDNSRGLIEGSDTFFNVLPDAVKKSFYEYEQNQTTSLNRLKQSIANEYFQSGANSQSFVFNGTQNESQTPSNQLNSNKEFPHTSSVNNTLTLPSSSDQPKAVTLPKRSDKTVSGVEFRTRSPQPINRYNKRDSHKVYSKGVQREDYGKHNFSRRTRNHVIPKSTRRDVMTLYSYRKQKESLLEKKHELPSGEEKSHS